MVFQEPCGFVNVNVEMLKKYLHKNRQWLCLCDCCKYVQVNTNKLKTCHTTSCGCFQKEVTSNINKKYIYSGEKRLYHVYKSMIDRCYNTENKRYLKYGGSGICVCDEWIESFDSFAEWSFGNGYDKNAKRGDCTIDRIDVFGDYKPTNCRWITNSKQQNNKSNNRILCYKGEMHNVTEWSKILNVSVGMIMYHLNKGRNFEYIVDNYILHGCFYK